MAYEDFAEDDMHALVKELCSTYASIIKRPTFENHISFFDLSNIDAHETHYTLKLDAVHINFGQKQLTIPVCKKNKKKLQSKLSADMEKTEFIGRGWQLSRIKSMYDNFLD